jgi:hypothetical protein
MAAHIPAAPSVLDVVTLPVVQKEVADRARDWRSAWRLHPICASARSNHDPRMVRFDELESLGRWLAERIADADVLSERVCLTEAGRAAAEVGSSQPRPAHPSRPKRCSPTASA